MFRQGKGYIFSLQQKSFVYKVGNSFQLLAPNSQVQLTIHLAHTHSYFSVTFVWFLRVGTFKHMP